MTGGEGSGGEPDMREGGATSSQDPAGAGATSSQAPPGFIAAEDPASPKGAKQPEDDGLDGHAGAPPLTTEVGHVEEQQVVAVGDPPDGEDPPVPPPAQPPPTASKLARLSACCQILADADLPEAPWWLSCDCLRSRYSKFLATLRNSPLLYCQTLATRPWAYVLFWGIVLLIVIPISWRPVQVDADIDAFRRADGPAASNHSAFLESLGSMRAVRNETALSDRTTFKIEIFYESKEGSVFSEGALRDIRSFEQDLRNLPGWSTLCNKSEPRVRFRCSPGESLGNYVWPRRLDLFLNANGYFGLAFDGTARERLPVDAVVTYLGEGSAAPHNLRKFLPMDFTGPSSDSKLLRSVFSFTSPTLNDTAFRRDFDEFVEKELYNNLLEAVANTRRSPDPNSWDKPWDIRIYFRGSGVDDYEVLSTVSHDAKLAIGPLLLCLLVAWGKMRSAFLAFVATLLLNITVLMAYVILPVEKVSPASFLGIFLVFGLGFTSMFRVQELWRRSRSEADAYDERLVIMHVDAVREMLPVVCSSACYFLLFTSKLKPLREFGIFIGASMVTACIFALLIMVPVLIIHERWLRPLLQRKLPRKLLLVLEPVTLRPNWGLMAEKASKFHKRPKPVLGGTALAVFVTFVTAVAVIATREVSGLSEIFPPEHHKDQGRPLAAGFAPSYLAELPAPATTDMCEPRSTTRQCGLHWCDIKDASSNNESSWPDNVESPCSCNVVKDDQRVQSCNLTNVSFVFSGDRAASTQQSVLIEKAKEFAQNHWPDANSITVTEGSVRRLRSLVVEDWVSGSTQVQAMIGLENIHVLNSSKKSLAGCSETVYCYCNPQQCKTPSGFSSASTQVKLPVLQQSSTPADPLQGQRSTEVAVLFGIEAQAQGELEVKGKWAFDTNFDPSSPWSQRAMLRVCTDLPSDLKVLRSSCWIQDFRSWLIRNGQKFPVERFYDFQQTLKSFLIAQPSAAASIWMNEGNNMTATMLTFQVTPGNGATETLKNRNLWLEYLDKLNNEATSTAAGAWATSQAWVDSEAADAALGSAWQVLFSVLGVVLGVALIYTLDFKMVGLISLLGFCISTWIMFIFFCLFGWSFGPWELTTIAVFLSYSVEPALHICNDFIHPGLPDVPDSWKPVSRVHALALTDGSVGEVPAIAAPEVPALPAPEVPALESGNSMPAIAGASSAAGTESLAVEQGSDPDPGSQLESLPPPLPLPAPEGEEVPPAIEDSKDPNAWEKVSKVSDMQPKKQDTPEDALKKSVHLVCKNVLWNSAKLILCGFMLLPAQFRIFSRLGGIAIVLPLLFVPTVLILLPTLILFFGRTTREPDVLQLGQYIISKTSWMWQ